MQNGYLTKDQLRSRKFQRRYADVELEGLGKLRLQSLNAREQMEAQWLGFKVVDGMMTPDPMGAKRVPNYLAAMTIVDGAGQRLFEEDEFADWVVDQLTPDQFDKLQDAINKHLGVDNEPVGN